MSGWWREYWNDPVRIRRARDNWALFTWVLLIVALAWVGYRAVAGP